MPLRSLSALLLALGLLAPAPSASAQEVTLRYQFPDSEPLLYRSITSVDMSQTIDVAGQTVKTKIEGDSVVGFKLLKQDAKGMMQVETETKRLKVNMGLPAVGNYSYDSTKDENDDESQFGSALTPMYDRLSTAKVELTVQPRGTVTKLSGYKELFEGILDGNPIANQFAAGGSEEAAMATQQEMMPVLPAEPVGVGDTWDVPFEVEMAQLGKMKGKRSYKLTDIETEDETTVATIEVSQTMNFDVKLDTPPASGNFQVASSKGTLKFDVTAGRILSFDNEYTLKGNLKVNAGGMEIGIDQEQTQKTTKTLIDELPPIDSEEDSDSVEE